MREIVDSPLMEKYIEAMNTSEAFIILDLLKGLNSLLHTFSEIFTADGENILLRTLEKHNLSGVLTSLQNHKNEKIYK